MPTLDWIDKSVVVNRHNEVLISNEDSKENRTIVDVWEKATEGKCLFVMPRGPDLGAITKKIKEGLLLH